MSVEAVLECKHFSHSPYTYRDVVGVKIILFSAGNDIRR